MSALQDHYVVHEREHIREPQVLGRVRALVGGGEAKIDAGYMALFPALELIAVCGWATTASMWRLPKNAASWSRTRPMC